MTSISARTVLLSLLLAACHKGSDDKPAPPTTEEAGRARVAREAPVAEVAPAALPTQLPLIGKDGVDADGYPLKWVDRPALRSLLHAARYADLTKYFESFQAAFEADPKKEYWPNDAAAAFASAEPELLTHLDAWVNATPQSFAPYLARGTYRTHLGFVRRGTHYAVDTPESDLAAMKDTHDKALADLEKAFALRPKLVTALAQEIDIAMTLSDNAGLERAAGKAEKLCPTCLLFRVHLMNAMEPRWGGSYDAMARLAKSSPVAQNAKLRFLPGYIDIDQVETLLHDGKLDEALAATEKACARGEYWRFLQERAHVFDAKKDLAQAARDIERASELRPDEPGLELDRARTLQKQQRYEAAGWALLAGLRLEPTNSAGRSLLPYVMKGLVFQSGKEWKAGRKDDALRIVELAIDLDPQSREAHGAKNYFLEGQGAASAPDAIEKLQAAADAAPNDLRAHQALDYALAKQSRFADVVAMWTRYLDANPRDGLAHMERGGAFFQLGRKAEALADAKAACDLGVSDGCARAKMMQ
jgi:tetratricopeptide (TPR) repeat protein